MLIIRCSKISLLCAVAFYATIVVFGNITDYQTNFEFVKHVMSMDSIFPDSGIIYRAMPLLIAHHIAYLIIIITEILIAVTGWYGVYRLLCARNSSPMHFNNSKAWGVISLTLGFILWQVGFMSVGGEWFGMWMSKQWDGIDRAFQVFMMFIAVLIYVAMPDGEI